MKLLLLNSINCIQLKLGIMAYSIEEIQQKLLLSAKILEKTSRVEWPFLRLRHPHVAIVAQIYVKFNLVKAFLGKVLQFVLYA